MIINRGGPINLKFGRHVTTNTFYKLNDEVVKFELENTTFEVRKGPVLESKNYIVFSSIEEQREIASTVFHNYIVDIFGSCSNIKLHIKDCHFHPPLPPMEALSDTVLSGDQMRTDYFEELLTKYPNQNSISIYTFLDHEPNNQIFNEIKNIFWRTSLDYARLALLNFNGNNMVLRMANINNQDIIQFLRDWVSNRKYQNLETISIKSLEDNILNVVEILQEFTIFNYDPDRRPENYEYDPKIADFEPDREDSFECSDFLDIEREADKKLASLKIRDNWFWFCVWK
ncbi:unnamed protein product [Caenorhabditis brenneri]